MIGTVSDVIRYREYYRPIPGDFKVVVAERISIFQPEAQVVEAASRYMNYLPFILNLADAYTVRKERLSSDSCRCISSG